MRGALEDDKEISVLPRPISAHRIREPEFEGHVESGGPTDAREVMDRYPARLHKFEDSAKPSLAAVGNLKDTPGRASKRYEGRDDPKEDRLIGTIERNVQEYSLVVWKARTPSHRTPRMMGRGSERGFSL